MKSDDIYITASELGDYVYCSRSWWLRINGLLHTNQSMLEGQKAHNDLATSLNTFNMKWLLAISVICFGLILFIIAIIILVFFHS